MISTSGKTEGRGQESCQRKQIPHDKAVRNDKAFVLGTLGLGALTRATVWPSVRSKNANFGVHFAQPDTEDKKLRKDLTLEVPCFEGTLRTLCCDPNEVPWPGQLRTLHSRFTH